MTTNAAPTIRVCDGCGVTADTARYIERRAATPGNPYSGTAPFGEHKHVWTKRPRAEYRAERAEAVAATKRERSNRP